MGLAISGVVIVTDKRTEEFNVYSTLRLAVEMEPVLNLSYWTLSKKLRREKGVLNHENYRIERKLIIKDTG